METNSLAPTPETGIPNIPSKKAPQITDINTQTTLYRYGHVYNVYNEPNRRAIPTVNRYGRSEGWRKAPNQIKENNQSIENSRRKELVDKISNTKVSQLKMVPTEEPKKEIKDKAQVQQKETGGTQHTVRSIVTSGNDCTLEVQKADGASYMAQRYCISLDHLGYAPRFGGYPQPNS